MRYMFLMYSQETAEGPSPEDLQRQMDGNWEVMRDAREKGVLLAVEGLKSASAATTVRMNKGKPIVTDGPFTETKEHLAGYYILECKDLEEAIAWAARIPTACKGREGGIEIRPVADLPQPPKK